MEISELITLLQKMENENGHVRVALGHKDGIRISLDDVGGVKLNAKGDKVIIHPEEKEDIDYEDRYFKNIFF